VHSGKLITPKVLFLYIQSIAANPTTLDTPPNKDGSKFSVPSLFIDTLHMLKYFKNLEML
jgi:hypothetical protein